MLPDHGGELGRSGLQFLSYAVTHAGTSIEVVCVSENVSLSAMSIFVFNL